MRNCCIALLIALSAISCKNDNSDVDADFDRTALLENLADNIILPAYQQVVAEMEDLSIAVDSFLADPDENALNDLRTQFTQAYRGWQLIAPFEVGPAENAALRSNINTYPTNVSNLEALITAGSYNLDAIGNISSKGLPALDYLLFGIAGTDDGIVDKFVGDPLASNYRQFLSDITEDMLDRITAVRDAWTGGYASSFKSNKGNSIGSSIGLFVNAYILHYERFFRTLKIGLPVGIFSLEGDVFPDQAEARYSGISADLIREAFDQLVRVFNGTSLSEVNGIGLDDHLQGVDAGSLAGEINSKFVLAGQAIDELNDPMTSQLLSDRETVLNAYSAVQALLPLFKADMTSALSIQITYTDNDGD